MITMVNAAITSFRESGITFAISGALAVILATTVGTGIVAPFGATRHTAAKA